MSNQRRHLHCGDIATGISGHGRVPRSLLSTIASRLGIAGAMLALGAMGLLTYGFGDTLLQWQPLPAAAPARPVLVYASALILIAGAIGMAFRRTRGTAATMVGGSILLWAILLHLPLAWAARGSVASLNGVAENLAMAVGLGTLANRSEKSLKLLRRVFGLCCVVFGTAHYVYADFTAGMVPAWLPCRLALVYLTGTIHVATGLLLLLDRAPAIAAAVEAMMMVSFVLLLHLPRVVAAPSDRLEVTMLAMALMLSSSAWLVAARAPRSALSGMP